MKKSILYILVILLVFGCTSNRKADDKKILVFCASSLTNVISEIAEVFESENHIDIQFNFASSGTLARQIEHGATPALYISANKKWVAFLNDQGKTIPGYEKNIAGNSLVAIVSKNSSIAPFYFEPGFNFPQAFSGRLSIGDPKHVPAGDYAMQALEKLGYSNELNNRLLPAKDVRSALLVVELGETEMGIVYKTDALKSKKVKIVADIPTELHMPVAYHISILKKSKNDNALLFYEFLHSEPAKKIWIKNGFKVE